MFRVNRALYALVFLLCLNQAHSILINEIMYEPIPSNLEWVEIYNEDSLQINLSGWKLFDNTNKTFIKINSDIIQGNSFAIITEDSDAFLSNHTQFNGTIFEVSSISLNNAGEIIRILNKTNSLIDEVNYSSTWGSSSNYSLELIDSAQNNNDGNNWRTSFTAGGTPGLQNAVLGINNIDYSVLSISEFIPDPTGDDNAPTPNGEWIEIFNNGMQSIDLKWFYFKDLANHKIYISDITTQNTIINPNNFLVFYTNGFSGLLNNLDIEEIKFYSSNGSLIDSVSYADSIEGSSWSKVNDFWQKSKPTPGAQNVNYDDVKQSTIEIENILDLGSDKKAKFGQTIRVKFKVYKGDLTKDSIKVWVERDEKLSKETRVSLYTKFQDYDLTIPIQIFPNCDGKYLEGKYTVFVEGLDIKEKETFTIEGNNEDLCQEIEVDSKSNSKFEYSLLSYPETIFQNKEFSAKVEIKGDNKPHELEVWSYVYKGSESVSGDRELNKQIITLPEESSIIIDLKNKANAEPGNYKLKVKIKKDDQKTIKEITSDIVVAESSEDQITFPGESRTTQKPYSLSTIMFESSQRKAEKLVPYGIVAVTSLTVIFVILLSKGIIA